VSWLLVIPGVGSLSHESQARSSSLNASGTQLIGSWIPMVSQVMSDILGLGPFSRFLR
jgi:hypothetical protein